MVSVTSFISLFFSIAVATSIVESFRIKVNQGSDVSFICPNRFSINRWTFHPHSRGRNLTGEVTFPGGGNVLKIPNVQLENRGWYTCIWDGAPPHKSSFRLAFPPKGTVIRSASLCIYYLN